MRLPIFQLDAFTDALCSGNPAAVIFLPEYPDDATLQAIFVTDGSNYWLRRFTPAVEVPLCGHAALVSAAGTR